MVTFGVQNSSVLKCIFLILAWFECGMTGVVGVAGILSVPAGLAHPFLYAPKEAREESD